MKKSANLQNESQRPTQAHCTANAASDDLFPDLLPSIPPASFPSPGSRADEALQALLESPVNQADYWKSWRLAAAIDTLKNLGWPIVRRDIQRPGCRTPVREYALDMQHSAFVTAMQSRQKGAIDANLCGALLMTAISAVCLLHLMAVV